LTKFNEVLNVSPNEQEAMYEKAFCLSKLKANREAKEILEESIKIKDRPYSLLHEYNLLGNLYSDEGRQLEAIECYEKAIPLLEPGSNVIAAKLYHNISNELFGLSAENREKRKDWDMEALNYAGMAIKHLPIHSNAYYIVGNILSTKKAYYQALSFYVISALFSGKGTADIEDDLATWQSMGLVLECGDETVMAFNIVNELMQKKPSEYGKLYDVFSAVFSGAMKHSNETPLPVAYSGDTWEQSLLPFLAELSRKGLLECFCHLAMVNSRKYGMANEKWLEKNDDKCKELNK
jgi:tetratricopeptide (TPR) repeat protein